MYKVQKIHAGYLLLIPIIVTGFKYRGIIFHTVKTNYTGDSLFVIYIFQLQIYRMASNR